MLRQLSRVSQNSSVGRHLVAVGIALCVVPGGYAAEQNDKLEEVVVRGTSSITARLGESGSSTVLTAAEITSIGASHVNETLARVPGVWVSRGSGQEHLTAIRSAVYTGAGACGEFSFLENGVPLRPAGFCNINNLFPYFLSKRIRIGI